MKSLTVLYDENCGFCERTARWLRNQAQITPLQVIPASHPDARQMLLNVSPPISSDELIVFSDDGSIWRGASGMLMCLWALEDYHHWSYRLSSPALKPLVRRAFHVFSSKRHTLSRMLGMASTHDDTSIMDEIRAVPEPECDIEFIPLN